MKLSLIPTTYDIMNAKGDVIAYAYLKPTGYWLFHDFKNHWYLECQRRLKESELLDEYRAMKTRWYAVRKAERMKKKNSP